MNLLGIDVSFRTLVDLRNLEHPCTEGCSYDDEVLCVNCNWFVNGVKQLIVALEEVDGFSSVERRSLEKKMNQVLDFEFLPMYLVN